MTQTLTVRAGPDGVLTLPLGEAYANKLVQVTVQTVPPAISREEWLRFIENTAGKIDDPTFVRHPQGEYDQREEL
jgi:hypothetical protein